MSMMPNAMESIPDYQPAPPDAQPRSLPEVLDEALALIMQDRVFTPDEQQAVVGFLTQLQQIGQMQQQQAQAGGPGAMGPQVQQRMNQGGFGQPQERQVGPAMNYGG